MSVLLRCFLALHLKIKYLRSMVAMMTEAITNTVTWKKRVFSLVEAEDLVLETA